MLHRASDSTHSTKGRTSVFADRRSTFKASQTVQKNKTSMKIDEKSFRQCIANSQRVENSIFPLPDTTWCRFRSPRRAPRRAKAPFLASRGTFGDPSVVPAARRGRSATTPRRSRDAFRTVLDGTGRPEMVPGTIFSRFGVPRGVSRDRFCTRIYNEVRSCRIGCGRDSQKYWSHLQLLLATRTPHIIGRDGDCGRNEVVRKLLAGYPHLACS